MFKNYTFILFCLLLSACSGGGGNQTPPGGENPPPGVENPPPQQGVYGLAAEGAPISNTTVFIKDSQGVIKQTTTDSQGKFSFPAGGSLFQH